MLPDRSPFLLDEESAYYSVELMHKWNSCTSVSLTPVHGNSKSEIRPRNKEIEKRRMTIERRTRGRRKEVPIA